MLARATQRPNVVPITHAEQRVENVRENDNAHNEKGVYAITRVVQNTCGLMYSVRWLSIYIKKGHL